MSRAHADLQAVKARRSEMFFEKGFSYAESRLQAQDGDEIERICRDIARTALEDPTSPATYHIFGGMWQTELHFAKFPILRFMAPVKNSMVDGLIRRGSWVGMSSFFTDLEKKDFKRPDDEATVLYLMHHPQFKAAIEEVRKEQQAERAKRNEVLRTRREETMAFLRKEFKRSLPRDPDDKTPAPFSLQILYDDYGRFAHESGVVFSIAKTTDQMDVAIFIATCPEGHELYATWKANAYAVVSFLWESDEAEPLEQDGEKWRERATLRSWLRSAIKKLDDGALHRNTSQ